MDARQLRYFVVINEKGALSRAAQELRVAVSALSNHLANLEIDLGSKLFGRLPRGPNRQQPVIAYIHTPSEYSNR